MSVREDAEAAISRMTERELDRYDGTTQAAVTEPDIRAIRTALIPELPADLAAIQARHQASVFARADRAPNSSTRRDLTEASADDVPVLLAELAELRAQQARTEYVDVAALLKATPQLSAKQAKRALLWMGEMVGDYPADRALWADLKAIAEQ
jgi:hypothetical protein